MTTEEHSPTKIMNLKPSEIFFVQDSINNVFDRNSKHSGKQIGETLDDLCEKRCTVSDIPTISVMKRDGKWMTADNRRLWVFRQLEQLGKCVTVPVQETSSIPLSKTTSNNGGVSIIVRGDCGGTCNKSGSWWGMEHSPVQLTRSTRNKRRYSIAFGDFCGECWDCGKWGHRFFECPDNP